MRYWWTVVLAATGAMVSAAPGLLRSGGLGNPWLISASTCGAAAVGVVLDRWHGLGSEDVRRRDDVGRAVLALCLTINGRLPR